MTNIGRLQFDFVVLMLRNGLFIYLKDHYAKYINCQNSHVFFQLGVIIIVLICSNFSVLNRSTSSISKASKNLQYISLQWMPNFAIYVCSSNYDIY